jgi:hypothetical protein
MRNVISTETAERIREEFMEVLDTAVPPYEVAQLGRFSPEDEKIIQQSVGRLSFVPELPNAGDAERRIVQRLRRMSHASFWEKSEGAANWADAEKKRAVGWLANRAMDAAAQWAAVLPENPRNPGWYFVRHPLTYRMNKPEFLWLTELLNCAVFCKDRDAQWFAQLLLEGSPEGIADFRLEILFLLRKPNGVIDRLVRLKNIRGEVNRGINVGDSDVLEAVLFSAPEKFRAWSLERGNFSWSGNQTHLQMLHRDVAGENTGRTVDRIDSCGWHFLEEGLDEGGHRIKKGIWFFDDCAILPSGQKACPDENGIIWHDGRGYFLNNKGRESEFVQGRPKMSPHLTVLNCGISYDGWTNRPTGETEEDHLRVVFREFCQRSYETIGGYDAWLSLGAFFAFAAAPEIFDIYKIFPGLLIHGQMGSGKNKWVEWQMGIFGFDIDAGLSFQSATAVGMLQAAENYSNLPVAVDEFGKGELDLNKVSVLHSAANRQMLAKWVPEGTVQRKIKSAFVVSGERTRDDAAFRSRYLHVQVSADRRLANHLAWFDANKRFFFLLGRFLLERRAEFVRHTLRFIDEWRKNSIPDVKNEREKLVLGISYGAWMATCALLQSHEASETTAFRQSAIEYLRSASEDVFRDTNVIIFWRDFITCWKANAIPRSCLKVKGEAKEHPPGMPGMGPWISYTLFIEPNTCLSEMQAHLSRQNGKLVLGRNDLRDQMKALPYFRPPPKDAKGEKKYFNIRFGSGKDSCTNRAWAIGLDEHPDGLQRNATRDDYNKFLMDETLGDPRKGPLFAIVHALIETPQ